MISCVVLLVIMIILGRIGKINSRIVSCTPVILSRMITSLFTHFIISTSAPKVLVPILSASTILQRMVKSVTITLSYTFRMMIILPKKNADTSNMNSAVYNGDRINITLQTYYKIMPKSFNDLSATGYAHALNYTKKINAFEQDLKDLQAIYWCVISKGHWDNFLPAEQTFDIFCNKFYKYILASIRLSCLYQSTHIALVTLKISDEENTNMDTAEVVGVAVVEG